MARPRTGESEAAPASANRFAGGEHVRRWVVRCWRRSRQALRALATSRSEVGNGRIGESRAGRRGSPRRRAACGAKPLRGPASVGDGRGIDSRRRHRTKTKGPKRSLEPFVFVRWWRRRESNPRPQALHRQFYILSTAI